MCRFVVDAESAAAAAAAAAAEQGAEYHQLMALLYLEDFVESIETLPQDIKHCFSNMRTQDLKAMSGFLCDCA